MKIVYPEMQLEIELIENQVQVISIENSENFTNILNELWNQTCGNDGQFILSDMEKELNFNKDVELIINPFCLDPNNKKILTSVYHQLDEIINEDLQEETTSIRASLVSFLDILIQRIPYPLDYDENTNIGGLYKMFGIKIDTCATTLAESIIDYLKARYLSEKAQGIVEYALVIAFVVIAAAALGTNGSLGNKIKAVFDNLAAKF